ncbi:MAG: signal peptide peptidase SppA [Armatimonadota bacterium]
MADGRDDSTDQGWAGSTGAPQPPASAPPPPPAEPPQGSPPAPHQARRGTNWLLVLGVAFAAMILVGGLLLVLFGVAVLASGTGALGGFGESVGVVTIGGVISAAGEQTLFGAPVGGARATMEQLRRAAKDRSIKAVVLRINSPGGSAAASQEIYDEVQRLAKKKPVVASMADVAASGGYYVAAAAHKIVANGSTVTGSIGVRMEYLQFAEAMDKIGVEGGNLTTGPYKDTGSIYREMRPDEVKLMQGLIDDMYEQFIQAVADGREMKVEEVRKLADGRVYTGEQALKLGLIDELGNFYRAVELAGEMGGIEGEPRIRDISAGAGLWDFVGGVQRALQQRVLDHLLHDARLDHVDGMMRLPEMMGTD